MSDLCGPCTRGDRGSVDRTVLAADFYGRSAVVTALINHDFSTFFKAVRAEIGLTQEQFGFLIGLAQSRVCKVENGTLRLRDVEDVARLASTLGIPVGLLGFGPASDVPPIPGRKEYLIASPDGDLQHQPRSVAGGDSPVPVDHRYDPVPVTEQPDGDELRGFYEVLNGPGLGDDLVTFERRSARLDQRYAQISADVVLPRVGMLFNRVVGFLRSSRTVSDRRRLCAVAGRLAGLRAWALFDLGRPQAADAWYEAALHSAGEAEDWPLYGWLTGARSLIASAQRRHRRALRLIEAGQAAAATSSSDPTVRSWLSALEARARAGTGDSAGYLAAQQRADRLTARTCESERRHGMDFVAGRLDTTYYAGTGLMLLRQPGPASDFLRQSLDALPAAHTKARAVLTLNLAHAAALRDLPEEASEGIRQALVLAAGQPIMPILDRAREVRRLLKPSNEPTLRYLDEHLDAFATRLSRTATRLTG